MTSSSPPPATAAPQAPLAIDTRAVIRWRPLSIFMLCGGACLVEIGLHLGLISTRGPVASIHLVAGVFLSMALVTARVRFATYQRLAGLVMTGSIAAITTLTAAVSGTTLLPIFYAWPLLGAAYLLTRRGLAAVVGLTGVACGAAMSSHPGPFPVADYLILMTCGAVIVLTVRVLSESLNHSVKALRHLTWTDPLTGLLNRRGFDRLLARQFQRSAYEGSPLASLVLDIDHFKSINDTYGHPAGDAALKHFADLLRESCRPGDILGRIGGEEFAVVMPGATTEQALARATDFARRLRESSFEPGVRMTASIGIATDTDQPTFVDMLTAADAAVYQAKRAGRDRTIVAPTVGAA